MNTNNWVKVKDGRTFLHCIQFSSADSPSPNQFDLRVHFLKEEMRWAKDTKSLVGTPSVSDDANKGNTSLASVVRRVFKNKTKLSIVKREKVMPIKLETIDLTEDEEKKKEKISDSLPLPNDDV